MKNKAVERMSYYNSRHSGTGVLDRKRFADPEKVHGIDKKLLICYYCLTDKRWQRQSFL